MRLENTVKYHSPKSQAFTDSSRATDSETLTGSDIMAALGMAQSAAPLGFSAFSGKMKLSQKDKEKAIQLLTQFGMKHSGKVAALRKLDTKVRLKVVQTLAIFAFEDYTRSAASIKTCNRCNGKGYIEAEIFTMKSHYKMRLPDWAKALGQSPSDFEVKRQVKETVKVLCESCKGKGRLTASCNDCKGRGKAISKEKSQALGVPVIDDCKRCRGRGFERLPSTEAYRAICSFTNAITLDTWKKSLREFYVCLAVMLSIEESRANILLQKLTK